MKLTTILLAGVFSLTSFGAIASPICPTTSNNDTGADSSGCGVLITFSATGTATVATLSTGPYDGSDDATVGVLNNSSTPVSSLTLTSTNGAFGFDGDGIQDYVSTNGVKIGTGGTTGYEGLTSTFDLTGVDLASGNGTLVVNFSTPIAANGGTDYFSLEGDPASAGTGLVVGGATPEPASVLLLSGGLAAIGGLALRRRKQQ